MTVPTKYLNNYLPAKYFLSSYRALSDGRRGIRHLDEQLTSAKFFLHEWKIIWIGTCTILRTAIDLFRADQQSCLPKQIRDEIAAEWNLIRVQQNEHAIFWDFLRKERDNILHQYEWGAYEAWMKPDGTFRAPNLSLLTLDEDGARPILLMKGGPFEGRNSLDLLKEGADWVEARIFSAIRRAGLDPDEERGLVHFRPRPNLPGSILGTILDEDTGS
ncbi:hypothetical protein [Hyphomicrobium facile]|uniref:Uncharacterized protein n=1 Tax=Hyphomicrobium facile TaxID=51670 RepID=A0A1I7N0D8_9HYPH|nr:hypothetical protein [Hyphomicrobium facile]SFV28065.1 hypothetical protein SAMN04488557_0917 [Hyphomicrobium facile]